MIQLSGRTIFAFNTFPPYFIHNEKRIRLSMIIVRKICKKHQMDLTMLTQFRCVDFDFAKLSNKVACIIECESNAEWTKSFGTKTTHYYLHIGNAILLRFMNYLLSFRIAVPFNF